MSKKNAESLENIIRDKFNEVHFRGVKEGCRGILGAVLEMCEEGKTVEDIKAFCEHSLNLEGMNNG